MRNVASIFDCSRSFKEPLFGNEAAYLESKTNLLSIVDGPMCSQNLIQFGHATPGSTERREKGKSWLCLMVSLTGCSSHLRGLKLVCG